MGRYSTEIVTLAWKDSNKQTQQVGDSFFLPVSFFLKKMLKPARETRILYKNEDTPHTFLGLNSHFTGFE